VQTQNGLGRDISLLSDAQIVAYEKVMFSSFVCNSLLWLKRCTFSLVYRLLQRADHVQGEYANKLLYIATLAFAKLSIISLLMMINIAVPHRNIGIGLIAFIAIWGVVSVCVGALQCGPAEPWRFIGAGNTCVSLVTSSFSDSDESAD
jgi:hypothetical protein